MWGEKKENSLATTTIPINRPMFKDTIDENENQLNCQGTAIYISNYVMLET